MKWTLVLDDNDLIMVVKDNVVKQIDENRGELNRTEYVNHLIQCQLKQCYNKQDSVTREEFQYFSQQTMELLHNFIQFFINHGMVIDNPQYNEDFQIVCQQLESLDRMLESLDITNEETGEM